MNSQHYVIVRERDGRFYNATNGKFYRLKKMASKFFRQSDAKSYLPFLKKDGPGYTVLGLYEA